MIPVFYVPEMTAPNAESFSPSASKPGKVVADWRFDFNIAPEIEFHDFEPADRDTLVLAHDPAYVDGVMACRLPNGFSNKDPQVAASLPYTTGSMLAAARFVLGDLGDWTSRPRIACSPTSGFHHAHYAGGGGYCTFNGLMITPLALKAADLVDRVLILDCDEHYGDGTQDIIQEMGVQSWVTHVTHRGRLPGSYSDKAGMLRRIRQHVPKFGALGRGRGLVLYQAGADPHVDDPLGGFLTTADMAARDRLVFVLAVQHRVPLVWNLAGGYQRDMQGTIGPVLSLHRQTMVACMEAQAAQGEMS
jgi:acetoin utilization deacetylase AcuC-like enzyme